jgi:hypothetical protein
MESERQRIGEVLRSIQMSYSTVSQGSGLIGADRGAKQVRIVDGFNDVHSLAASMRAIWLSSMRNSLSAWYE